MVIGLNYSDVVVAGLLEILNTFIPQAPPSYSDKTGEKVAELLVRGGPNSPAVKVTKGEEELMLQDMAGGRVVVKAPEVGDRGKVEVKKGVSGLTFEDTIRVAMLENKAFSNNEGLKVGLANLENALIAIEINNKIKDRESLSLKYVSTQGEFRGYVIAHEGKFLRNTGMQKGEGMLGIKPGEKMIYIDDFSVDPDLRDIHKGIAASRLIGRFIENYKREYLGKGDNIPIYAEFREGTSYRMVKDHFERMGREYGVSIELVEDQSVNYQVGEETMHRMVIRIRDASRDGGGNGGGVEVNGSTQQNQ